MMGHCANSLAKEEVHGLLVFTLQSLCFVSDINFFANKDFRQMINIRVTVVNRYRAKLCCYLILSSLETYIIYLYIFKYIYIYLQLREI